MVYMYDNTVFMNAIFIRSDHLFFFPNHVSVFLPVSQVKGCESDLYNDEIPCHGWFAGDFLRDLFSAKIIKMGIVLF